MYFEKIINLVRSGCSLSLLLVKALNFNLVLFKRQRYNFIQYKSIKSDYFVRCLWVNNYRIRVEKLPNYAESSNLFQYLCK